MITSESIKGPIEPDKTDSVFVTLEANNGTSARYSLFALNLKQVPDKIDHQGRTYERTEGNVFVERSEPVRLVQEALEEVRLPFRKKNK